MRKTRFLVALAFATAIAVPVAGAAAKTTAPAAPPPVEGVDYQRIDTPDPIRGRKVQVVEVFGYGCPYCNHFQPTLVKWQKTLPADVAFSYLPAAFGSDPEHCWDDFARAFYAAQALGIQARAHDRIYDEVFVQHRLASCESVPTLWADFGADAKTMAARMQSFDISAKIAATHDQIIQHWGVDGTPTLVIDGTWRVAITRQGGPEGLLRTADWLIAKQRPLHKGR